MSKGLGQKIAIKFTEELNQVMPPYYPIYKFYRWTINSKWSSYLYLYEIEMFFEGVKISNSEVISAVASDQYSSYAPDRAFDGSTSSYWYTRGTMPQWIMVELDKAKAIDKFRWYIKTTSYKPKDFILQGSNDGVSWENVYKGVSPQDNYWIDFSIEPKGDHKAFTVSGQEAKHVNGPLVDKEYRITSAEKHPAFIDDKHLLLTMHPQSRFNNSTGNLTVEYDASKGSLSGRGGPVESSTHTFLPTDLIPLPNPYTSEKFTVGAITNAAFSKVAYRNRYVEEKFTATASANVTFTYVGVVNP